MLVQEFFVQENQHESFIGDCSASANSLAWADANKTPPLVDARPMQVAKQRLGKLLDLFN